MAKGYKTGGRQRGTPNKLTKEIRTLLKDIIYYELENVEEILEKLKPKERFELLIKLLPYALPKVEQVNYKAGEPIDWDPF